MPTPRPFGDPLDCAGGAVLQTVRHGRRCSVEGGVVFQAVRHCRRWVSSHFGARLVFTPLLQYTNGFRVWYAFLHFSKKAPMMAIFIATTRLFIMAKIEVMEYYELALNWVSMGAFLKRSKNADQTWKWFVNWSNGLKVIAKRKKISDFMAISFVFWAKTSTGLWDPLGCLDLPHFFGSSPTLMEWDKIIAEIINATFVFLGHPNRQRNGVRRG